MRYSPFAAVPLLLLVAGCGMRDKADAERYAAHGAQASRDFAATGFDRVSLRGPDNVTVKVGGPFAIHATGDAAAIERLRVGVVDGELRVERDHGTFGWQHMRGDATVTVSLPALQGASVSGSGNMRVDQVRQPKFVGGVAGSGDLDIAAIAAEDVALTVAGSGDLHVAGRASRAALTLSGSGGLVADGLDTGTLVVSAVGSGDVAARARDTAKISIIGSGDVTVKGTARCAISRLGSGDARCGG